ncbi:unnamed protein product [Urochloa humidicola]
MLARPAAGAFRRLAPAKDPPPTTTSPRTPATASPSSTPTTSAPSAGGRTTRWPRRRARSSRRATRTPTRTARRDWRERTGGSSCSTAAWAGAQLRWLDGVLRGAARRGEKAMVCTHLPVHPRASSHTGLMWNYEEVLEVVRRRRHGGSCVVVACLAGHDHGGGYAVDDHGVHHRTLEAALECPPGTDAFGRVDVYPDRLSLVGSDRMASTEMLLNTSSSTSELAAT